MYYFFANREALINLLPAGLKMCEVGVQKGIFSRCLLATNPSELHLIDPWEHQQDEQYKFDAANVNNEGQSANLAEVVRTVGQDKRVQIHRGYSQAILPKFPENTFDFLYIDGNHTYQAVLQDLRDAYQAVKNGGIIAGHDFCSHWRSREGNFGVVPAVVEFCKSTGCEVFGLTCSFGITDHSDSFSTYFISKGKNSALVEQEFMRKFFDTKFGVVELPNCLLGAYTHSTVSQGRRYIPSFK